MLSIAGFGDDFYDEYQKEERIVYAYGAGKGFQEAINNLPQLAGVFDKHPERASNVSKIPVFHFQKLTEIKESIYLIVTVKSGRVFDEICTQLNNLMIIGKVTVFHYYNNVAFQDDLWASELSYLPTKNAIDTSISVNIVCRDNSWIFSKFAQKMRDELISLGVNTSISADVEENVDINHHIPYVAYKPRLNDTLMITHVDTKKKIDLLKKQLKTAALGICMSRDTMDALTAYGIPRWKLCFVHPAHDKRIVPHKYLIGITHKCHDKEDVRKRADELIDVLNGIDPMYFAFVIMGGGWERVIEKIQDMRFEVTYYPTFDLELYTKLMSQIDYYLYMGFDEGSMGFLDAVYAGAGTIVTPQGYHMEAGIRIDYPCCTVNDFHNAFLELETKRKNRIQSIDDWTWKAYAEKHLAIWEYILKRKTLPDLFCNQGEYMDGIFSMMLEDNRIEPMDLVEG